MILFTNGCSWTWGGSLGLETRQNNKKRLESVWPHHLGELLNSERTYNLSLGCGSNDRILRTTFDWLNYIGPEALKETVAVIQFTELSRFEYYVYDNENDPYENKPLNWAVCKVDCVLSKNETNDTERNLEIVNNFISKFTDIQGYYKLLFQLEALTSMFDKAGVKCFYWTNHLGLSRMPEQLRETLMKYPWIESFQNQEQWKYDRVSKNDAHPSLNGHIQLADIIYNKIKDRI